MSATKKEPLSMEEPELPEVYTKKSNGKTLLILCTVLLIVALIVAVLVVLALAIVLGIERSKDGDSDTQTQDPPNVCLTNECVQAAADIRSRIDESIDPCVDFYNFACGSWLQNNVIPVGEISFGTSDKLMARNSDILRQALEQLQNNPGEQSELSVPAFAKLFTYYTSCITLGDGVQAFLSFISNTGGWPLIGIAEVEPWSINGSQLVQQHNLDIGTFFKASATPDPEAGPASGLFIWEVAQPEQDVSVVYVDASKRANYYVTLLKLLEPGIDEAVYEEAAQEVVAFESSLERHKWSKEDLQNLSLTYNRYTLRELHSLWEDFDWLQYFQSRMQRINLTIDEGAAVVVTTPSYFEGLAMTLRETNTSVLQNYARLQLVLKFVKFISEEFTNAANNNDDIDIIDTTRTKECVSKTSEVFFLALSRYFVNRAFQNGTKETVSMMTDYISEAFMQRLDQMAWLDETTRQRSKEKVDAIVKLVGYPDRLFDDSYLNDVYADIQFGFGDYFFDLHRKVLEAQTLYGLRTFTREVDRTQWLLVVNPLEVNAAYTAQFNQFYFQAGIFGSPYFRVGWPDYLNFGGLGYVIGHELTHGFDNKGQRFDKDGILRQWWTNASNAEFISRHQCFIDQYNRYPNGDFQVNGRFTLGENIADNGGIKAAFQAHSNRLKNGGTTLGLPSLGEYTPDQLFFITYAQQYCLLYTDTARILAYKFDEHSPADTRVTGPLVNSPEFAEAFSCREGTPMNPPTAEKCFLW